MKNKCYVGNLPYSTTEDELEGLFGQYGEVAKVTIIYDRDTDKSKGFAFVELASEEQAQAAITALNEADVGGRKIVVNEAREREAKPRDDRGSHKNHSNRR